MAKTLAESLKPASVHWETLHKHYNPLLNLVRELIGLIPNCDPTLEIWPPGFRTYNLLVPNMLQSLLILLMIIVQGHKRAFVTIDKSIFIDAFDRFEENEKKHAGVYCL